MKGLSFIAALVIWGVAPAMPEREVEPSCVDALDALIACLHADAATALWNAVLRLRQRELCEAGFNPMRLSSEFRSQGVCQVRSEREVEFLELAFPTGTPTRWLTVEPDLPGEDYPAWFRRRGLHRLRGSTVGIVIPQILANRNRLAVVNFVRFLEGKAAALGQHFFVRIQR